MLNALAQAAPPGGAAETIDKLARTPISAIVMFVAAITVARVGLYLLLKDVPTHRRGFGLGLARFTNEAIDAIVYALIFVFLLIRPFGLQTFRIPTGSMLDTLQIHDFIVANKAVYRYSEPKVGDIVVFKPPEKAKFPGQDDVDFIKRLVGVPGQVVEIRDGVLYRDGKPVEEPYVQWFAQAHELAKREVTKEEARRHPMWVGDWKLVRYEGEIWPLVMTPEYVNYGMNMPSEYQVSDTALMAKLRELPAAPIPKGWYLMMGDNRLNSYDGRYWGLVPEQSVIGRAEFIWFPISRWGMLR
ncbi:MAG TPA: signal peptidase I [Fimbriimonadaceae bacterium]|nr:signal peptidase I [Fimbriimonadaceae bacterium]